MLYLRIETFISATLRKASKMQQEPREQRVREEMTDEEIINEMFPKGSVMREVHRLGKRYYVPAEKGVEEVSLLEPNKGYLSMDNIVEHTLLKISKEIKKRNKD